jgi:hypothetical protein
MTTCALSAAADSPRRTRKNKEIQMKFHLAWIRTTAAAALAVVGSQTALGQYPPYGAVPQQYNGPQQQYSGAQPYVPQPAAQQYPAAQYPQAPAQAYNVQPARPTAYQPAQQPNYSVRPQQYAQQQPPYAAYPQTAMRPNYSTLAQNNGGPTPAAMAPSGNESLPTPAPMNGNVGSNNGMDNSNMGGGTNGVPAAQGYDMGYQNGGGCSTCGGGYPSTGAYGGDYGMGGYGMGGYGGSCGCGQQDYGIGNYFDQSCGGRQWFGGVYYLFMDRTNPSNTRLATAFDTTTASYPYYPPKSVTILQTNDATDDFRSGGEIRFGSTFSISSPCDTCNTGCGGYGSCNGCGGCNVCATQDYAWEAAWWAIDKDVTDASYTSVAPAGPRMIFGMKNFAGELYDRSGGGMMPVNNYFNYGIPVPAAPAYPTPNDGDVRIRTVSERTSFSAQNIELNFLRLPMVCGGCASSCDAGCGGCNGCGCSQPSCGSAFTVTGLCGVRFFRIDDDFRFADQFYVQTSGAPGADGNIYFDRSVDDLLTGFQWGANMNYCVACRWNFFCDTAFGIYDNHQRVFQQFTDSDGGTFSDPTFRSSKDSVAFLGELRIGGAYDISCHWRAVAAYRAVALSGVALATDLPTDFADHADASRINSDNSVIIHGIQTGVECRY